MCVCRSVFQTELMGIDGVPKPDPIIYEETSAASEADEAAETDDIKDKVADKIADAVEGAAEAIGTMLSDTDDIQEHNEL